MGSSTGLSLSKDAVQQAKAAIDAIGLDHLQSFEIGNEPDLYVSQGVKGSGYNLEDYVKQWLAYADQLNGNFTNIPKRFYQALTFASGHAPAWNQ